jgi:hypothetical protein
MVSPFVSPQTHLNCPLHQHPLQAKSSLRVVSTLSRSMHVLCGFSIRVCMHFSVYILNESRLLGITDLHTHPDDVRGTSVLRLWMIITVTNVCMYLYLTCNSRILNIVSGCAWCPVFPMHENCIPSHFFVKWVQNYVVVCCWSATQGVLAWKVES